jgi:hypothetical protein
MPDKQRQNSLFDAPSAGKIAEVVRDIVRAVKADHAPLNNSQLGVAIGGVSADTIDRLEGGMTAKVPASVISGIAARFGSQYVQPYFELFGCRAVPMASVELVEALPAVTALAAKMAAVAAEGLNHKTVATFLKELRDADAAIAGLRASASNWGLAA